MKKLWLLGYDVVEIAGGYRHASFQGSEVQFSQTHIHTETLLHTAGMDIHLTAAET